MAKCTICNHAGANMRRCKKCGQIYCRPCADKGKMNGKKHHRINALTVERWIKVKQLIKQKREEEIKIIWIIIIAVTLILLKILFVYLELPTCPQCKSKKASVISEKEIEREPIYFKEKQRMKEYQNTSGQKQHFDWQTKASTSKYFNAPEKIIEKDVLIEGERIYYDVTYECSKCGKIFHRNEHTDKKPTIINNWRVRRCIIT